MLKTFTGYSSDGLDVAVKDAYNDFDAFYETYLGATVRQVTTTSHVEVSEMSASYWFTLTVLFDEVTA